ncbi:outer membrane beta-barrel protein [Allohahella sp. A8]|uniref:outer membrane beta-barrel protein n=1 Tax=Allohahella sp. A8 TaxID=3141461 RepID=UPI000C0B3290|nr:hypothetical protein [Hahellaceae bacterium]|tara:strand:+ start:19007 stop:19741 length:735 start_codon:yes stop_codon:yes gene_type:complete
MIFSASIQSDLRVAMLWSRCLHYKPFAPVLLATVLLSSPAHVLADDADSGAALSSAIANAPAKKTKKKRAPEIVPKHERSYIGIFGTQFEVRGVTPARDDLKFDGASVVAGTYISENFRLEARAGTGLETAVAAEDPANSLEFDIDYYVSGLVGPQANLTDYFQIYGLVGVTRLVPSTERSALRGFPDIPEDLVDSSFSFSYVLGADVHIYYDIWASLEFGQLHKDTITNIRTEFLNVGLKFEF